MGTAPLSKGMRLLINGENRVFSDAGDGLSLQDLLRRLELPGDRVAVERNGNLVRRPSHGQTRLTDGDVLEIVTLVGGG